MNACTEWQITLNCNFLIQMCGFDYNFGNVCLCGSDCNMVIYSPNNGLALAFYRWGCSGLLPAASPRLILLKMHYLRKDATPLDLKIWHSSKYSSRVKMHQMNMITNQWGITLSTQNHNPLITDFTSVMGVRYMKVKSLGWPANRQICNKFVLTNCTTCHWSQ